MPRLGPVTGYDNILKGRLQSGRCKRDIWATFHHPSERVPADGSRALFRYSRLPYNIPISLERLGYKGCPRGPTK